MKKLIVLMGMILLSVGVLANVSPPTTQFVNITAWSTDDQIYVSGDIDIHNNTPWSTEGNPFWRAHGGWPDLPANGWSHPNADPNTHWEHDWSLRDEWFTFETLWMEWTQVWANPFPWNIAHIRVISDREIDPSSLWIINVDVTGHSANLLKSDEHIQIEHSSIRWGKDNRSFVWSFPHAPLFISGLPGNPVHIGFDFIEIPAETTLQ